mgnify:CR=1 FL=1
MPRYDFECSDCDVVFEEKVSLADLEKAVECPLCESLNTKRTIGMPMIFKKQSGGTSTKMKIKDHNDGRCYYEENQELTIDKIGEKSVAVITQIGFNDWLSTATEKQKNKLFKWHRRALSLSLIHI